MQSLNIFNNSLLKKNIAFRGYDATKLKNVYLDSISSIPFYDEMIEIAKKEGFNIRAGASITKWIQDYACFIEYRKKPYVKFDKIYSDCFKNELRSKYSLQEDTIENFYSRTGSLPYSNNWTQGGNMFLGKNFDGEKFLLIGENDCWGDDYSEISKAFNVPVKNIYSIPQASFHLDMFLRPIGYPYVLVNDPNLVIENIKSLDISENEKKELISDCENYFFELQAKYHGSVDDVVRALENYGFIPIRIAGVYGQNINFMNAIVNKRSDNTLSYITNSSKCFNDAYCKLEEVFKEDILKKVSNLKNVYFVSGKKARDVEYNYMMDTLQYGHGGLHCMSVEEPDFEAWG